MWGLDRKEMKDFIVFIMGIGLMALLFVITFADFVIAFRTDRALDKDIINLLSMAITGIVGIVAGFISGKNAAQAEQPTPEIAPPVAETKTLDVL